MLAINFLPVKGLANSCLWFVSVTAEIIVHPRITHLTSVNYLEHINSKTNHWDNVYDFIRIYI